MCLDLSLHQQAAGGLPTLRQTPEANVSVNTGSPPGMADPRHAKKPGSAKGSGLKCAPCGIPVARNIYQLPRTNMKQ